jgi:hypothetical protein
MVHLFIWIVLGFLFPDKFILAQLLGIFFEILELLIVMFDNNTKIQKKILNIIGGCLYYPSNKYNEHHILDKFLGPHSKLHWWHFKLTDVIMNIIGFIIGINLYKLIF